MNFPLKPAGSLDEITYPLGHYPPDGGPVEILPGLLWLHIPLNFGALTHVNAYLLEDDDGWTLVDAGLARDENQALWETVFADHLKGKPVIRNLCTHSHPDHVGLTGWISERWSIPVTMTFGEWVFARMMSADSRDPIHDHVIDFLRKTGAREAEIAQARKAGHNPFFRSVRPLPSTFERIAHGSVLTIGGTEWHVMIGRGHSPEHACLYAPQKKVLISGDIILPRISPHIGVFPTEPTANPLAAFLATITDFRQLPAETLVLPSHGDVFFGLHHQLDYYASHHDTRIGAVYEACAAPQSALDLVPVLFKGELSDLDVRLGIFEVLSHCNYLVAKGRLARGVSDDGLWVFQHR